MAEAATVIQLLQFTGQILSKCYDYIDKARNAPREIQNAINEVSILKSNLERLKRLVEDTSDSRFQMLKSLNEENGPFDDCAKTLQAVEKKIGGLLDVSETLRRLQWPLAAPKIVELIQRLERHKTIFMFALAGDAAAFQAAIQDLLTDTHDIVLDIQASQVREKILGWLKGPDPAVNHHAAVKKREVGTCQWLLASEEFKRFVEGDAKLMWLHAIPGGGKTVLSSTVVEHFTQICAEKKNSGVIYYYFDFRDNSRQSHAGCLQSLLRQICSDRPKLPDNVVELYELCRASTPSTDQILEALIDVLDNPHITYIVIDALDECIQNGEQKERECMLEALETLVSSPSNCKIFVASRPEADIRAIMKEMDDLVEIEVQASVIDEDIRLYVRSELQKNRRLKGWDKSVKKEIEDSLMKNARGM
jgi:hypothetical protein